MTTGRGTGSKVPSACSPPTDSAKSCRDKPSDSRRCRRGDRRWPAVHREDEVVGRCPQHRISVHSGGYCLSAPRRRGSSGAGAGVCGCEGRTAPRPAGRPATSRPATSRPGGVAPDRCPELRRGDFLTIALRRNTVCVAGPPKFAFDVAVALARWVPGVRIYRGEAAEAFRARVEFGCNTEALPHERVSTPGWVR